MIRQLPNAISIARLLAVPALIVLAYFEHDPAFSWVLVPALLSDTADGLIARLYHLESRLGAILDSVADELMTIAATYGIWVFHRDVFEEHAITETSHETSLGLTESVFNEDPFRRYAASQKDLMQTEQSQYSLTHFIRLSKMANVTTTAYRSDFARNWYKLDKVKDSTGKNTAIADVLDNPSGYHDAYAILTGATGTHSNALYVRANNRTYYAQGIQSVLGFSFETRKVSHSVDLGFRYHQDQIDRFQWDDEYAMNNGVMQLTKPGVHGTESNRINSADAFATYLQYKIRYKKFTVTPGLRYENITMHGKDYGKNDPERTGAMLVET